VLDNDRSDTRGTSSLAGGWGYTDTDTGLQYLRTRYYDPSTGQFMSVDPVVNLTGDPYAYAGDNPVNNVDPTGLCVGIAGYCLGFHPLGIPKGVANFAAGAANSVTSIVGVHVPPPFCGELLQASYDIGGATAALEAGVAGGAGVEAGARALLRGVLVGGVKVGPIVAPLVGGAGGAVAQGLVQGEGVSPGAVGTGALGGLAGNLGTGLFSGRSASGVSGVIGSGLSLVW
jgi:RHS repeat-associated protein